MAIPFLNIVQGIVMLKNAFGKKEKPSKYPDEHEPAPVFNTAALEAQLIEDEGLRLKPYEDSTGVSTIGVGHSLRNGISHDAAMFIFREDLKAAIDRAEDLNYYDGLSPERKMVIVNMIFNLGFAGFLRFKKLNAALSIGDYETAAKEMLSSKWAKQVGQRAIRLSETMKGA